MSKNQSLQRRQLLDKCQQIIDNKLKNFQKKQKQKQKESEAKGGKNDIEEKFDEIQALADHPTLKQFQKDYNEVQEIIIEQLKELKVLKSFQVLKLIQAAVDFGYKNQAFWDLLSENIVFSTEYSSPQDMLELLQGLVENERYFQENLFTNYMENIIMQNYQNFSCTEFIQCIQLFEAMDKISVCKDMISKCKHYVVEDIDNLTIQQLLTVIEVYKEDYQFKRFIGYELKEKILKNSNLTLKELMNVIIATLDLEDLRRELISYCLNSEKFFAFPVGYLVSILTKMRRIEYHSDFYDLLKTIQIQCCLYEAQLAQQSFENLIRLHQDLPILNPQFMAMILRQYNLHKSVFKKTLFRPFNLNISLLNLPNQTNQSLIEEYELALVNHLSINSPENFNTAILMRFLIDNPQFAKYGFYKGFNDIIFSCLLSDEQSGRDQWLLNNLYRIVQLECSDQEFYYRVEKLIENHFDRFASTALLKLISLVIKVCPQNQRIVEQTQKRVRMIRPELISDHRVCINFCLNVAYLFQTRNQEVLMRLVLQLANSTSQFSLVDIQKILEAIKVGGIQKDYLVKNMIQNMTERAFQLMSSLPVTDFMGQFDVIFSINQLLALVNDQQSIEQLSLLLATKSHKFFTDERLNPFLILKQKNALSKISSFLENIAQQKKINIDQQKKLVQDSIKVVEKLALELQDNTQQTSDRHREEDEKDQDQKYPEHQEKKQFQ